MGIIEVKNEDRTQHNASKTKAAQQRKGADMTDNQKKASEVSQEDIDNVLKILENFGTSETARMKITTSDELEQGKTKKQVHLGRCDVKEQCER